MLVIETKLKGTQSQYAKLDYTIRTAQFVRNKCLRHWEDNKGVNRNDLQKICSMLAKNKETPWVDKLNSQARQTTADRAWQAISRFYTNCRQNKPGKKGYPKYKKCNRSVEYKKTGWKLCAEDKQISFTDGFGAGTFKLWTSRDLKQYSHKQISRIRIIRRADDYDCQFLIDWHRREKHKFQGNVVGIDLGLKGFYTDSNGNTVENPRYLRKSEQLKVLTEYRYSTGGHPETDPNRVNALMSFDRWLVGVFTNLLSRLAELRISGCAEKPPLYSQN